MQNPFDLIDTRLANIENLLLDLKRVRIEPIANEPEYITRREAAAMLYLSLNTLDTYTRDGKLKAYRIGNRILYKPVEIKKMVAA